MAEKKTAATETAEREENLQRYELVYLVANKFTEDEFGGVMAEIAGLLKKNGAKIVKEDNWGKRRLAYPIGAYRHAYYAFLECDMPGTGAQTVENNLRLDERIMRHLLVKTRIKTAEEIEAERRAAQSLADEKAKGEEKAEPKKSGEQRTERTAEAAEKKSDAGKVEMEKLDEKLNKIIDDAGKLV